jgi:hypothetical protein
MQETCDRECEQLRAVIVRKEAELSRCVNNSSVLCTRSMCVDAHTQCTTVAVAGVAVQTADALSPFEPMLHVGRTRNTGPFV